MANDILSSGLSPRSRPTRRSSRKTWLLRAGIAMGAAMLTLTTTGAFSASAVDQSARGVGAAAIGQPKKGQALNIALIGSTDNRDSDGASNDIAMILHLDADREHAYLVSFPRATFVPVGSRGGNVLPSQIVGQVATETLEDLTGTKMDHFIVTDRDGFLQLALALGPLTVNNPVAFSNWGFQFDAGPVVLSGLSGLAYVSTRIGGGDAPGAREERQRLVVQAGFEQGLSRDVLSSPTKLNAFIDTATASTTADRRLTTREITKIAKSMRLTEDKLTLIQAPLTSADIVFRGRKVQPVESEQFQDLARALESDTLADYLTRYQNPCPVGSGQITAAC